MASHLVNLLLFVEVGNTIRLGQISMKILEMAGINHLAKNAKSPLTNYLKDYESKVFEAA